MKKSLMPDYINVMYSSIPKPGKRKPHKYQFFNDLTYKITYGSNPLKPSAEFIHEINSD